MTNETKQIIIDQFRNQTTSTIILNTLRINDNQNDRGKKKRDARFRISHLAKRNFFQFPFSHEKKSRKNEFLPTKMSKISDFLRKEKKFSSHFSLRRKKFLISLSPWRKGNFLGGFPFPTITLTIIRKIQCLKIEIYIISKHLQKKNTKIIYICLNTDKTIAKQRKIIYASSKRRSKSNHSFILFQNFVAKNVED